MALVLLLAGCSQLESDATEGRVRGSIQALDCDGGSATCDPVTGEGAPCGLADAGTFGLQGDCPTGLWCNQDTGWCQSALLAPGQPIPGVQAGCLALLSGQVCQSGFCNTARTACGCQIDQECTGGNVCDPVSAECTLPGQDAGTQDAGTGDAAVADAGLADAGVSEPGLIATPMVSNVPTPSRYNFTVQLATQPTADVTLTFSSDSPAVLKPPPSITIPAASWNMPRTVFATARASKIAYTGGLSIQATSADPDYAGKSAVVTVSVLAGTNPKGCSVAGDDTGSRIVPFALLAFGFAYGRRRRQRR